MSSSLMADLFAVIAPVFFVAAAGFAWGRSGRPFDTNQLTPLITHVGTPCLVLSAFLKVELDLAALGQVALASAVAHALFCAAGWLALHLAQLPKRPYLGGLMFPNSGNMGLPLCLFAFGEEGLALAIGFFAVSAVSQFTIGQAIAAGHASPKRLLSTPIIWALALALILVATETELPRWAFNTVDLAGQFTIPLMLLALGVSLSRLGVGSLGRSGALSVLRIAGGVAVGFLLAWLFDLEGMARGVVIIQCAMPVAVFNYLFAQLHNNRPEEVAGMVVLSTALSFATLPILLGFILP